MKLFLLIILFVSFFFTIYLYIFSLIVALGRLCTCHFFVRSLVAACTFMFSFFFSLSLPLLFFFFLLWFRISEQ